MSALPEVMTVVAFVAGALAAAYAVYAAVYLVREIVLQRRGEEELVSRLVREEEFRRALGDYWEVVDRDGPRMTEPMVEDLARLIEPSAAQLGARGRFVEDALRQSSAVGRTRYVKKLMSRASREMENTGT